MMRSLAIIIFHVKITFSFATIFQQDPTQTHNTRHTQSARNPLCVAHTPRLLTPDYNSPSLSNGW